MAEVMVIEGRMPGCNILIDPETGETVMDEYMDPTHLPLGHEEYTKLQKQRVNVLGEELLKEIKLMHPHLRAYAVESSDSFRAVPEGMVTEFNYKIKSMRGKGLWGVVFPRTLTVVCSNNGMMSTSCIDITDESLKENVDYRSLAKRLGQEYLFSIR